MTDANCSEAVMDFDMLETCLLSFDETFAHCIELDDLGEGKSPFSLPLGSPSTSPSATLLSEISPSEATTSSQHCLQASVAAAVRTTGLLPPCRVCGGAASGFHYGVNTCKACKGFFHRCLHRKSAFECENEGKCPVSLGSRLSCPACRYQRCVAVGMTKEAAKIGRYTHSKRTQDTLEIKRLQNRSNSPVDASPNMDVVSTVAAAFEQCFRDTAVFYTHPDKIEELKRATLARYSTTSVDSVLFGDPVEQALYLSRREAEPSTTMTSSSSSLPMSPVATLTTTSSDLSFPISNAKLRTLLKFWAEKMDETIRALVSFAKSIPGFKRLPMEDQIVLIKAGRPEASFLLTFKRWDMNLRCMLTYNVDRESVILLPLNLLRSVSQDDDLIELMHRNLCRLVSYRLCMSEVALLVAIALVSPDREHLTAPEQVETMQNELVAALTHTISTNHCKSGEASRILAGTLLLLPVLRTGSEIQTKTIEKVCSLCPLGLSPLLQECFSHIQQPASFNQEFVGF